MSRTSALARSALRLVSSPATVVVLAAPPAALALLAWGGAFPWDAALEATSARSWAWAAGGALAAYSVRSLVERRLAGALAGAAVLLLAAFGAGGLRPRVDATADAGEGEEGFGWTVARAGPGARPPELVVLEVPEGPGAAVRLRVDGREVLAAPGRDTPVPGGLVLTVEGAWEAPSFSVRRTGGALEQEGLLKLEPGKRGEFQVGVLPHRFLVTLPAGGAAPILPDRISVRVQRGKLKLAEREVALDEPLEVEGLALRLGHGARWARVRVRSAPPWWALGLSAALLAASLGAAWRDRKGRRA